MNYNFKNSLLVFAILILVIALSCGGKLEKNVEVHKKWPDSKVKVFNQIAEAIGDSRVVALGESSHGIGDYYTIKSELIQYLHQNHNFDVLAFESSIGDLNLAWNDIDSVSGRELLDKTLFWNFKCEEVIPLFDYVKNESNSDDPLIYTGFDNQLSSSYFIDAIQPIIEEYDQDLANDLEERLKGYVRWFRAAQFEQPEEYNKEAEMFTNTAIRIQTILNENKIEIKDIFNWNEFQFDIVNQTIKGFIRTVELPYDEKWRNSQHRDEIMVDNFKWLLEEVYPNKKIIIWAHNAHIEKTSMWDYKWMGHYLAEELKEDYYSLGLFAKKGSAYRQWGDTIISFDNNTEGMIEYELAQQGETLSFVDFDDEKIANQDWVADTMGGFEPENGGEVYFIPIQRFSGTLFLNSVGPPTFYKN